MSKWNQSSKSMCTCGSKSGVKNKTPKWPETQECPWKNQDFPSPKSDFPCSNSIFFNGFPIPEKSKKIFFNGFLISSMAFCFLQRISSFCNSFLIFLNGFPIFLNGFPLSKKSGKICLWRQVYKRLLSELCTSAKIAIFCDKNIRRQEYKRSLSELHIFCSELCNSC